jgi:hypothetical protein
MYNEYILILKKLMKKKKTKEIRARDSIYITVKGEDKLSDHNMARKKRSGLKM